MAKNTRFKVIDGYVIMVAVSKLAEKIKARNPAIDVIRIVALLSVVSIHFFLRIGYNDAPMDSPNMYIMAFMRSFFTICVPLFLVITGFLMCHKELSRKYYKGIVRTLAIYVLCSVVCIIFYTVTGRRDYNFIKAIQDILSFQAAPYSWYIEMYIGLFLLIPFLNLIYNGLKTQKRKLVLIGTMILMVALPAVLNVYDIGNFEWLARPVASGYNQILPSWWTIIYPIMYYFIGCYLREYGLKISRLKNILLIVIVTVLYGLYCIWRSAAVGHYANGSWNNYGSLWTVILTTLVFNLLLNIKYDKVGEKPRLVLKNVAVLCLGAYLVSNIVELTLYEFIYSAVPVVADRLPYFLIMVPAVFVVSLGVSAVVDLVYRVIEKMCGFMCNKIRERRT